MLSPTPKSSPAIVEIERLGFNWSEEAQFDLDLLSVDRRVQVRDSEHYAPAAQVSQFAIQMAQTQYPPIIVSRNNWLVDGNTRVGARELRKEKFSPAIIIDADFTNKDNKTDNNFRILAATLNQTGGQRLTPTEARKVARILVEMGWKPEQIGRALGIKATMVSHIKRELAAEARFDKVGFKQGKDMQPPVLRAFGTDVVLQLNDVPYEKLADLAVAANLGPKEVKELAAEMKATGSDAGMIAHIDKREAEMEERIRDHALRGNGKPAPSSQLRRVLGNVTKFRDDPAALVERTPDAMVEHVNVIRSAIDILNTVADLQAEIIDG